MSYLIKTEGKSLEISKEDYLYLRNNSEYSYSQEDWECLAEVDQRAKELLGKDYNSHWTVAIEG